MAYCGHKRNTFSNKICFNITQGMRGLDIGSGTGYLTACMALMVGERGRVIGIEHIPELVENSIRNVRRNHANLLTSGRMRLMVGDGRKGFPEAGPYNAIHVGAAAHGLPQELIAQLAPGELFTFELVLIVFKHLPLVVKCLNCLN